MLTETTVQGFPALDIANGVIGVTVVPDLGGKFASLRDLRSGREWLWTSPVLPYARVPHDATDPNHYVQRGDFGGWDECFPSVSACAYPLDPWRGRPVQDHGELWSAAWRAETARGDDGRVALALAADGVGFPYTFRRTLTVAPGAATLRLDYAVRNTGDDPFSYIWSAHPLLRLEPGMRVALPAGTVVHLNGVGRGGDGTPEPGAYPWPLRAGGLDLTELPPPGAGVSCKLWSEPLAAGWVRLTAPGGTLGLAFDPALLPQVGLWVNAGGWSGTGGAPYNNFGLEPCCGAQDSLADAVEVHRRYRTLAPGETHAWWLEVTLG